MPYTHRVLPLKRASSSPSALPPLAATLTAGSVSRPVQLRSRAAIRSVASARRKRGDVVVFYCVRFGALYTHVSAPITARRGGGVVWSQAPLSPSVFRSGVHSFRALLRLVFSFAKYQVSIWNIHGVSRGFEDGGLPPASHDFAAGFPSSGGKKPPPTFLTVYGEQVEK